jgi:flagellar hook assembly protein FlgD
VNASQSAGSYSARWNARDDAGAPVPSGIYLYRLQVNGFSEVRKLVVGK